MRGNRPSLILLYVALVLYAAIALTPLLWMLSTSLKGPSDIFRLPPEFIPRLTDPPLANYETVWTRRDFFTYFRNSLIVAGLAAIGQVMTCALAGYAFARLPLRGKDALFAVVLGTAFVPAEVTIIPEFLIMRQVGWIDTWAPLIVPSFLVGAFGTFLLKEYFGALPEAYGRAAEVDGATPFQIFRDIYLPLATPALISVFVIAFINNWDELLRPLIFLNSRELFTVPLGLDGVLLGIRGGVARADGGIGDFGLAAHSGLCSHPAIRGGRFCRWWPPVTIAPRDVLLASGEVAKVLVLRPAAMRVDPGFRDAPAPNEVRAAQILGEARLGATLTPVPGPEERLSDALRISHPDLGDVDVFSERARRSLIAEGMTQAPLFLLRQRTAEIGRDTLAANSNYFLFGKEDFDSPWNAYGDPIGLVLSGGVIDFPAQLPRAAVLAQGHRHGIARPGFADMRITLPNGAPIRAHPFGVPGDVGPMTAFARFHGERDGKSPPGEGYDVAFIGRYPAAGCQAGGLPIPRAGCVVRFPDRAAAIAALGPLTYGLEGDWAEAVQAGPQILADGRVTDGEDVFATEHMTETPSLPMAGTVSPAGWKADWDETRAARLGAGVDRNGALVVVAVEGTSSGLTSREGAAGATLRDLAVLMRDAGARDALHLDGGGSTQVLGEAGGAIIASSDRHHGLLERSARHDRPIPTWILLDL